MANIIKLLLPLRIYVEINVFPKTLRFFHNLNLTKRMTFMSKFETAQLTIVRSFKFMLKVGVEEPIVNALYGLRITDQLFLHEWRVPNRLFNANFENKFK
jgi:hypothetical protein